MLKKFILSQTLMEVSPCGLLLATAADKRQHQERQRHTASDRCHSTPLHIPSCVTCCSRICSSRDVTYCFLRSRACCAETRFRSNLHARPGCLASARQESRCREPLHRHLCYGPFLSKNSKFGDWLGYAQIYRISRHKPNRTKCCQAPGVPSAEVPACEPAGCPVIILIGI